MRLAEVILDIPTKALDSAYTYGAPESLDDIRVGCAVSVRFGGRAAVGFVMDLFERSPEQLAESMDPAKLKDIDAVLTGAFFDEEGAACARYLAHRYIAPLSQCVRLFTPPGGVPKMTRSKGYWHLEQPTIGQVDDRWVVPGAAIDTFVPRANAVKQQAVIDAVRLGDVRVAELAAEYGSVAPTLKTLGNNDVIRIERRRRMRGDLSAASDGEDFVASPKPEPTEGQRVALERIIDVARRGEGGVVVVDGVTGSGKTEVYLQAIEDTLSRGRNAIMLVPEISLTPQTVARFRGRFGDKVAVMHSRMSAGERFDQWDFIRAGGARVVVGARSALFTPMSDVGIIVIDEEHETTYKQDSAPRYVSRDVAAWMAKRAGAALVLGSATPSIEALHAVATRDDWESVSLPQRANGRPMPDIEIVDMAREFGGGSRSMFGRRLAEGLEEVLRAGDKAVLMLNQRGFAKFILCRNCGYVPTCPSCSTSLTFHEHGNTLVCHHCGHRETVPPLCPECGSPYLKRFGAGTQRVEAELRALIDAMEGVEARLIRMDADTTTRKGAHRELLDSFGEPGAAVLLGTQMIAKGLDFDDVTLVGVINADTQLNLPDFRSAERTFDLIEQVAGRAGRAEKPGRVFVQTYAADSMPIRAAAAYDRAGFLRDELPKRRALGYPPYVRLADVLVWGNDRDRVARVAGKLADDLIAYIAAQVDDEGWTVLPAVPCVLSKLRGTFRFHTTVKVPLDADPSAVLEPFFRSLKPLNDVNVSIDIDPTSLL